MTVITTSLAVLIAAVGVEAAAVWIRGGYSTEK